MQIKLDNLVDVIKVSELEQSESLEKLHFFGYNPNLPLDEQSVQIPATFLAEYLALKNISPILDTSFFGSSLLRSEVGEAVRIGNIYHCWALRSS